MQDLSLSKIIIDNNIDLSNYYYITTDLSCAYYQLSQQNDILKVMFSAFKFENETYVYNISPFGFSDLPTTFNYSYLSLLSNFKFDSNRFIFTHIDDALFLVEKRKTKLSNNTFRNNNVVNNLSKLVNFYINNDLHIKPSDFSVSFIKFKYCGYIFYNNNIISLDQTKVDKLKAFIIK